MSDTPRTDMFCRTVDHTAIVGGKIYQATIETVDASLARQLERELADARAEIENKQYSLVCDSERIQLLCEHVDELRAEIERKDALIEQMREIMEAAAGIAGKDWLWAQLALGETLDGKPAQHCEWLLKAKADYEAALSAAERGE